MKKITKVLMALALLFVICVPAFSQPNTKSIESKVIDDFDSPDAHDWKWTVTASRFIAEGYPKYGYYNGISNSLRALRDADDNTEAKVFGVQTAYNRKGDNWFEIYPTKDGKLYEIPFKGTVSQIDFWAWGAKYNYYLEVLVRDSDGMVRVLPCGSLAYEGWRNIIVKIPGWIPQKSKLRSGPKTMSFVGFRVKTDAAEYVDDFVLYLDKLSYMTHALSVVFDGYDPLQNDFSDAETGNNAGASTSSTTSSSEAK